MQEKNPLPIPIPNHSTIAKTLTHYHLQSIQANLNQLQEKKPKERVLGARE